MRVSEHIDHHARRVKRHIQERPKLQVLLSLIIIVAILSFLYYNDERYSVTHQDLGEPVACAHLLFARNMALCEERIISMYRAVPPQERGAVCEKRAEFGNMSGICDEYDEVLSEILHGAALREQGISIWEPHEQVGRSFRYRTLSAISDMHLVCDRRIVNITATNSTIETGPVNGSCVLIATTPQGTITSLPFNAS